MDAATRRAIARSASASRSGVLSDPASGVRGLAHLWDGVDLAGPRVRIRRYRSEDVLQQRDWPAYPDPLLETYSLRVSDPMLSWFRAKIETDDTLVRFAVEEPAGRLAGTVSLREVRAEEGRARLGLLIRADEMGRGLGTEVLGLFLDWYFGPAGFAMLDLDVAACNLRAVRLYGRMGFRAVDHHWQVVPMELADVPGVEGLKFVPDCLRTQRGQVWILHHDMQLTAGEWRAGRGEA